MMYEHFSQSQRNVLNVVNLSLSFCKSGSAHRHSASRALHSLGFVSCFCTCCCVCGCAETLQYVGQKYMYSRQNLLNLGFRCGTMISITLDYHCSHNIPEDKARTLGSQVGGSPWRQAHKET